MEIVSTDWLWVFYNFVLHFLLKRSVREAEEEDEEPRGWVDEGRQTDIGSCDNEQATSGKDECVSGMGYKHHWHHMWILITKITSQANVIQQNYLHHFTQNQLYIQLKSISHVVKKYPKSMKIPLLYRLGILPNFCHFRNVLKTLNKSYQQTHHLELNRMVQTILS